MKYATIKKLRLHYPVRMLCSSFGVSPSGYYSWASRPTVQFLAERAKIDVLAAHKKTRETYGAVRLHKELVTTGHFISLWKVKKLRRELGITCTPSRRFVRTTDSNHHLSVAPNLVSRNFKQDQCNRVWVSDITYISTGQGWLYLAGIKDLCSKEIVGFSIGPRMDSMLVVGALAMALQRHRPERGLILHSDRGSQYCSNVYQRMLDDYGIRCSMSKKGDCYDNAPMESFWGLLKNELIYRKKYRTHADGIADISEYIEIFYNRQRRQAALAYLSPAVYAKIRKQECVALAA